MGKDKKTGAEKSGKVSKKTIIISVVTLVIIFIVSFLGFSQVMKNNNGSSKEKASKTVELATLPLGNEFVVNLADEGSKRYIKATIVVAYNKDNKEFSKNTEEKTIVLRDAIINYLKLKTVEDTKNTEEIKKGLIKSLNKALGEEETIKDVYFQSLIVQ